MSNEKFRVKFGLAAGNYEVTPGVFIDAATIDGATGDIYTSGDVTVNQNLDVNGSASLGNNYIIDTVAINGLVTGNITFTDNSTTTLRGITGAVGANDYWKYGGGATATDGGYAVIATGDNGTEPIYVQQYSGASVVNQVTLLDGSGNTILSGDLTVTGNDIKSSTGAAALTFNDINVKVNGELTVTGNTIRSSGGSAFPAGDIAIQLSGSNVTVAGDLAVNGGDITTTQTTGNLFNTTATTVNLAGAATTVSIGANTGTTTVNNNLVADDISVATVDATNLEVTNIKAKDGTAAASIANTTGAVSITTQLTVDNININGNTLISTDTNGNITLDPNGTGNVATTFSNGGNVTNDRNYITGAIRNATTQTTNGDIWELNTSAAQSATNPYFRGVSLSNSADTTRGPATLLRSYTGGAGAGSASRGRLIFEKARGFPEGVSTGPAALQANDIMGSVDATGYSSTGWLNDTIPAVGGFFGFTASENWVSNTNIGTQFALTLAPTATTVTSGANLINVLGLSPQGAVHRSDTYDFQQGKSGTTSLLALTSTLATFVGDVRINGNDIQGSGGSSAITLTSANTATTVRGDAINLQTAASVGIVGSAISYNRVYGQWQNLNTITPAADNTAYAFALPTIDFANVASVNTTSRIVPGAAGFYKLQFSVQVRNDDSAAEHIAYFWWRKNGTDVPGSMGRVGVPKAAGAGDALTIAGWDNMISSANTTDYWELIYATDSSAHIDFPTFAATAFGPATSALFVTLVPVGA